MAKTRTQIQLDAPDHARLKALAARRGVSMAAILRMLVREALEDREALSSQKWEAFIRAAGCGRDQEGRRDVARRHDAYLYGGS